MALRKSNCLIVARIKLANKHFTCWETSFLGQSGNGKRGERRLLGRLENKRVAARETRTELPCQHHNRVVPRYDLTANTNRLVTCVGEVRTVDGNRLAVYFVRPAGVVLEALD